MNEISSNIFVTSRNFKENFWKISFKIDRNEWKYKLSKFNLIFKKWMKIIVKKIPKINKKNLKIKLVISEISNKF